MNAMMTLDPWIMSEDNKPNYQNDEKSKQALGVFRSLAGDVELASLYTDRRVLTGMFFILGKRRDAS